MLKLNSAQQILVLEIKIIDINRDPNYSDNDKKQMQQYYKKKITSLKTKK